MWFTDQNSKPLDINDRMNITLVINCSIIYKKWHTLIQPRHRIFAKAFGFLSFGRNMGKNVGKNISKILSSKYSQKILDHAERSATDASKAASIKVIQKTAESTGDLIGNLLDDTRYQSSKFRTRNWVENNG